MRKLRLAFGGVVIVSAVAFWVGCGSSSDDSLITSGDAGADTGSTTPTPTPTPTPPPSPTDAGSDADSLPDGAVAADGGTGFQDAGTGGTTSSLPCGAANCSIPSQSCCVASTGGGRSFLCVVGPASNCPVPDAGQGNQAEVIALKCSSSANCAAGQDCCANVTATGTVQSSCVAAGTCAAGGGGNEHAVLCTPDAGNVGCDAGVTCVRNNDWGLPAGFGTCGNAGGPF